MDFGIHAVETCQFDQDLSQFVLSDQYTREKTLFGDLKVHLTITILYNFKQLGP